MGLFIFLAAFSHAVEIKNLSVDFLRIKDGSRFLETSEKIESRAGINFDVQIVGPFFWHNRVFLLGGQSQVEWVSYQFQLGLQCKKTGLSLYYEHNSQHRLDRPHQFSMFPVYDGLGVTWKIK